MSADKSRAARLADALDAWDGVLMMPRGWREQTSAQLRRIQALEAQRDAFKAQIHKEMDANHALRALGEALQDENMGTFLRRVIAERDQLRAEVEALRADAERYRYAISNMDLELRVQKTGIYIDTGFNEKSEFDAAIDAARGAA